MKLWYKQTYTICNIYKNPIPEPYSSLKCYIIETLHIYFGQCFLFVLDVKVTPWRHSASHGFPCALVLPHRRLPTANDVSVTDDCIILPLHSIYPAVQCFELYGSSLARHMVHKYRGFQTTSVALWYMLHIKRVAGNQFL